MEKLTTILAVVPEGCTNGVLFDKVSRLVRQSGARIELFLTAPSDYPAISALCATQACGAEVGFTLHDSITPLREAVLKRAAEMKADLLVAPRAQFPLDVCPIPLLLLGKTPWDKEPRFVAALDAAEHDSENVARGILHVAGFLAQRLVAHVDILYSERELHDERLRMERAVRLSRLVREYHVGCERLQVYDGRPEATLPPLIAARHYDVLVVGNVPRHRVLLTEFRSVSRKLMGATEGDVLLVNPVPVPVPVPEPVAASVLSSPGQQLAHQA